MAVDTVIDGLHRLPGFVNMYLIEAPEGLVLIDAGLPGRAETVLDALRHLGRRPDELKLLVLTHAHIDHLGSAAAIVRATGARVAMHAADVPIAERGGGFRPVKPAPGLIRQVLFSLIARPNATFEPVRIDQHLEDGDVLPFAGGLTVIHCPGHCAGQIALLWGPRRVLFAADACGNLIRLAPPIAYEDRAEGERSIRKLAALDFDIACFGHGKPILKEAATRFRETFR